MPTGFPTGPLVDDGLIPPWMHALTGDVTQLTTIVNNRGGDRARLARMMVKARKPPCRRRPGSAVRKVRR